MIYKESVNLKQLGRDYLFKFWAIYRVLCLQFFNEVAPIKNVGIMYCYRPTSTLNMYSNNPFLLSVGFGQ